jgi:hypothetical protein
VGPLPALDCQVHVHRLAYATPSPTSSRNMQSEPGLPLRAVVPTTGAGLRGLVASLIAGWRGRALARAMARIVGRAAPCRNPSRKQGGSGRRCPDGSSLSRLAPACAASLMFPPKGHIAGSRSNALTKTPLVTVRKMTILRTVDAAGSRISWDKPHLDLVSPAIDKRTVAMPGRRNTPGSRPPWPASQPASQPSFPCGHLFMTYAQKKRLRRSGRHFVH